MLHQASSDDIMSPNWERLFVAHSLVSADEIVVTFDPTNFQSSPEALASLRLAAWMFVQGGVAHVVALLRKRDDAGFRCYDNERRSQCGLSLIHRRERA